MAAFEYVALDSEGNEKRGILEADSSRQVRQKLRQQGLIPTTVREANQSSGAHEGQSLASQRRARLRKRHITHHEVVLMTRQLATLLESGTPLEEALLGVAEQSERPRVKLLVMAVRSRVLEGHTLAAGFADFPHIFNEMYRATVSAGEESGHLADVLQQLADFTEGQQALRQKISSAAIYPSIMIIVSISIVVFLLSYVVPQLVNLFKDSGQELPWLTRTMITLSDLVKTYGIYAGLAIVIFVVALRKLLEKQEHRRRFHLLLLKLPILGKLLRVINTARYAHTLGILIESGVPVIDAMRASARVVVIIPIREKLNRAANQVQEGLSINKALRETHYISPMSLHLIATGESSGRLQQMLAKAAQAQERDAEMLLNNILTLFEPFMTLVMGGAILLIVLSVLLPIFSLSQGM